MAGVVLLWASSAPRDSSVIIHTENIGEPNMTEEHDCRACSAGCTAQRTDEKTNQEISAGPYLLIVGKAVTLFSLAFKWFF